MDLISVLAGLRHPASNALPDSDFDPPDFPPKNRAGAYDQLILVGRKQQGIISETSPNASRTDCATLSSASECVVLSAVAMAARVQDG
ncbi:MAG: hypothetical protein U0559_05250 [Anaerolineae bacterium]